GSGGSANLPLGSSWDSYLAANGQQSNAASAAAASAAATSNYGVGLPRNGLTKKVWLPPSRDGDRIYRFNNPNMGTFPSAYKWAPHQWRNKIGYVTYVQFMMDFGRDRSPDESNSVNGDPSRGTKVPLSVLSPYCPYHTETTKGGDFSFPPRTQPMHATRRGLIAAIQVIKDQNQFISANVGDRVSIVTFDGLDAFHAPKIVIPLTSDFDAAMLACTTLQATSDIGSTTATEVGLGIARDHIKKASDGGAGREFTKKVVILLTDGVPNAWQADPDDISQYMADNPDADYFDSDYIWLNSTLTHAAKFNLDKGMLFGVGMGLGANYDFLDRFARMSGTDQNGQSPRGSGNPAEYEARLETIFKDILDKPGSRLVK
ncbi:hypothetical protein MNBD_PLANCTO02-1880, partial [hydrothermal vent metagenome]